MGCFRCRAVAMVARAPRGILELDMLSCEPVIGQTLASHWPIEVHKRRGRPQTSGGALWTSTTWCAQAFVGHIVSSRGTPHRLDHRP